MPNFLLQVFVDKFPPRLQKVLQCIDNNENFLVMGIIFQVHIESLKKHESNFKPLNHEKCDLAPSPYFQHELNS